ncbi:DsbA family protein [Legionella jordanis]|uniref:27 kDa outer membrane protein n=1 Tax=Legionella jordanis TaxID=456 RepID=A0A0W0V973_9GAMM|nr:DsbA family protein [Legionella jordanis]KTD16689.1 27 kDa outer membrane protein [Legionella jordanis]RMX03779.1 DsbA family protein [Legionella jordanis]RMX22160.1 DsbA family protein [Legionella jordanis]VEH11843.1 27 kDa outer membrane protein [Legionella jordanis]HAT8712848.1 thioredoxin domain-containing protein [Legionella jordanis]
MKFTSLLTAGVLATAMTSSVAIAATNAETADSMSAAQKKEVEKIIHDYLVNNPEVLLEASQALQQKQQQAMQEQAQSAIKQNANQLFNDNLTVVGNPKGDVTLVEFFDYQCIHCKKMAPVISSLVKKNNNLKVIYKEFPIFGKSSDLASRAALAAAMQGKYQEMHDALIKQDKRLNEQVVMDAAKALGLNLTKLKTDMDSKAVSDALNANRQLAEKLHLMGTPAFIILGTPGGQIKDANSPAFIPGAASEEALQDMIKKASSNS